MAQADRVVRVFISSTFRDMQAEREELVKQVFPELRRRCRERQVELVEVDLRWGVTEAQTQQGRVLPICLAEIERCRPYFIGLLGERYGWVPDAIPQELLAQEPWLAEHLHHSVTELEILHGVLNNPDMAERSYFYFRDPVYLDTLPPERRGDFLSEHPAAQAKLARLKDRIRQSNLPLKEKYPDPRTVGQWILMDLWEAIDQAYPAEEVPDPLVREAQEHEAFAQSRARVYIGRPDYFHRLDEHLAGDGPPLVIMGESGVGKSALLANWVLDYRKYHPDDFVFWHFIGSTPQSADYVALLHRLLAEIKSRTADPDEVPVQPDKLREALPLWLAKASAWAGREQRRLVIILDGLNQLEDKENAPHLGWLPEYFPPQVRLILSTLPGRPFTALEKRGWPTFKVAPLAPEEMRCAIQEYFGIYRKTLDTPLVDAIVAAPQAGNPLYLKALLEELRIFGVFEELQNRVRHYLAAPDPTALYGLILERLEKDYERDRPGMVREALSLIWASRRGLTESELMELLGTKDSPLSRAFWSPLSLALEDSLVSRSGLLNFFHDHLRQGVGERYLPTPEAQQSAHLRLADYFEERDLDSRKADEFPWQLQRAQAWERLKDCLTDLDLFLALMRGNIEYQLMGYWLTLEDHGYEMVTAYQGALLGYPSQAASEAVLGSVFHELARFLDINATYQEAIHFNQQALSIYERVLGPGHPNVAASLNNLAALYKAQGLYTEAEPLYQRALALKEKTLGPEHPATATTLNNLAQLYEAQGRNAEAESLYLRALSILEQVLGAENIDVAIYHDNLSCLYAAQGRYTEAEHLCQCSIDLAGKVLGPEHPVVATALNNMACLYCDQERYAEAEPLYQRCLAITEKILGPEHPDVAKLLNNLATLKTQQERHSEAEQLYHLALAIQEKVLGPEHRDVGTSLNNLANLNRDQCRYSDAESLYRRSLSIAEKVLGPNHLDVDISLTNLASLYEAQGRYSEAEPFYERSFALREKALGPEHPFTIKSAFNLVQCLQNSGNNRKSAKYYRYLLDTDEKNFQEEDRAEMIWILALSHNEVAFHTEVPLHNWKVAEEHYRQAIELFQQLGQNIEVANVELNLQTLFHLSGGPMDAERVRELTRILKEAGDHRAMKGEKLLTDTGDAPKEESPKVENRTKRVLDWLLKKLSPRRP